jgi:beta-glucanase (GH16 family)
VTPPRPAGSFRPGCSTCDNHAMTRRRRTLNLLAIVLAGCVVAAGVSILAGPEAISRVTPSASDRGQPTGAATGSPTASGLSSTAPSPSPPTAEPTQEPTASPSRPTTFADEFDGDELDTAKWETEGEWGCCGLSAESDHRSGNGVKVDDGILTLRAHRHRTGSGKSWESALVTTRGLFSQRYGVFQARMRWTKGSGLWPAFWLLEADETGRRPEVDIAEDYPDDDHPGSVSEYIAVNHYRDGGDSLKVEKLTIDTEADLTADWHVYELEWRPSDLIVRFDGREVGRFTSPSPSTPMFLILDMVVGSPLGRSDDSTPSPAFLEVDWVRVYE